MSITGACDCGAATWRVEGDAVQVYVCHCLRCQTRSGSAFAEHAMVPTAQFALEGETRSHGRTGPGVTVTEVFCAVCHTGLFNRNDALPDFVFLRAGTLTESHRIAPMAHIWTDRKQPWVVIPAGVATFPASPSPEAFAEAAARAGSSV